MLFWRASKEHVRLPTGRPDAIARTAAHCPFGVMVFVTLIASRVATDVTLDGRGARGKSGHVDTLSRWFWLTGGGRESSGLDSSVAKQIALNKDWIKTLEREVLMGLPRI